mgnify:FL=1
MTQRITGVKVVDGEIIPIELEIYKCICISDMFFMEPATYIGSSGYGLGSGGIYPYINPPLKSEWIKGQTYEFAIDEHVVNSYMVYIDTNDFNALEKADFDKHFITIEEFRNQNINHIIE